MIKVQNGAPQREPVPDFLIGLTAESLADLSWTDPALSVADCAWWPEDDQSPELGQYQRYGTETLTVDVERKVVVVTRAIVQLSGAEISEVKKPIQDRVWEAIKAERDGQRAQGGVLVDANWFHTDTDSRIKWLGLKDTARDMLAAGALSNAVIVIDGEVIMWKAMTGDFVAVTVQMAIDVVEATKVLDKQLFKRAEQHYALMTESPDPASYDHSTEWPTRFIDLT